MEANANNHTTYYEDLKSPQWKEYAEQKKRDRNYTCEDCNVQRKSLDVHHCAYKPRTRLWEYPDELVMVLCRRCHTRRQKMEDAIRVSAGKFTRLLTADELQEHGWDIIGNAAEKWTSRYAEAFSCP